MLRHKKKSYKGENGRVLIIGGSAEYAGCLTLAGIACLRSGVDWVTVAAPEKTAWALNCCSPDLITVKLPGKIISMRHFGKISELSDNHDVILIGNGIGLESGRIIKKLLSTINKPFVIDADAIKSISLPDTKNSIITPHAKEFEMLLVNTGLSRINSINNIKEKIRQIQPYLKDNVVLLKGHVDHVFDAEKITTIRGGNERMAVAGTGDILAGLCAGYLAQTKDLHMSAVYASRYNKQIGNFLYGNYKYAYIASDMLSLIKKLK